MDFENLSTITLFDEDSVYEACMEEDGIISDDLMDFDNLSTISLFSEDIFNEAWEEQSTMMMSDYINFDYFDTNVNFPWEDCIDNKIGEKKE